jgi:hypothetical protein
LLQQKEIMTAQVIEVDPRIKYREIIISRGLKQKWVAKNAGCSEGHLSNVLACKDDLSKDVRKALNKALGVNY